MSTEPRWWSWRPNTYTQLVAASAFLLIVGSAGFYGFTRNWGRSVSYAVGYTTVVTLIEWRRIRRSVSRAAGAGAPQESEDEDYKPPPFGNGEEPLPGPLITVPGPTGAGISAPASNSGVMNRSAVSAVAVAVAVCVGVPAQATPKPGCTGRGTIRLSASDNGKPVSMKCGQSLIVSLRALPGSTISVSTNEKAVRKGDVKQGTPLVGETEFHYLAAQPGTSEIRAFRVLPFSLPENGSTVTGLRWDALVTVSR